MSQFNNDKNMLFMEPKTTQYGSHMIMTNVNKPTKIKYVNIDTRYRDEYNYNDDSTYNTTMPDKFKYNITLPETITDVKSVMVRSIEIPMTFYNISALLGNNTFTIIFIDGNGTKQTILILIPDGCYSTSDLINYINNKFLSSTYTGNQNTANGNDLTFSLNAISCYKFTYSFDFTQNDKYQFKSTLGWLLGFRTPTYTLNEGTAFTTAMSNAYPKYVYLAMDEYSKNMQNSFLAPIYNAFLTKNIISRVTLNPQVYPSGSVLPANLLNGLLISDTRNYSGKVNLQRFQFQLLTESGFPIDLNGNDFSLCLEIEHE